MEINTTAAGGLDSLDSNCTVIASDNDDRVQDTFLTIIHDKKIKKRTHKLSNDPHMTSRLLKTKHHFSRLNLARKIWKKEQ